MISKSKTYTDKTWVRLFFTQPASSPFAWGMGFFVSAALLFWAAWNILFASFPHWLLVLAMIFTAWVTGQIETHLYPALAPLYAGGWMPSLQKTLLTLGLFSLMGLAAYFTLVNLMLGILVFVVVAAGGLYYLPKAERKGPLQSFADLANSTQRIQKPGIRQVERLCLWVCLLWGLAGGLAGLDVLLTTGHPIYPVRLLGKEEHRGSKGGRTYTVSFTGWRGQSTVVSKQVSLTDYERLVPARDYELHTSRSLFGTERLERFEGLAGETETPESESPESDSP